MRGDLYPDAGPLGGADYVDVWQSGQLRRTTIGQISSAAAASTAAAVAAAVAAATTGGDIVNVKDFGAKGDGVTDDTAAIQAAINYAAPLGKPIWAQGCFIIAGSITLPPVTHIFGDGEPPTDGSYRFGTHFWCTGSGTAPFRTQYGAPNYGIELSNLCITAAPTSNYQWTLVLSGSNSARLNRVTIANDGTGGALWFRSDGWGGSNPPTWINFCSDSVFYSANGNPLYSQLTDSSFVGCYFTNGTGSVEAGANNRYVGCMFDNWSATSTGLTIQPYSTAMGGSSIMMSACNFQNTRGGPNSILIQPATGGAVPQAGYITASSLLFNNGHSTHADISIVDTTNVTISASLFATPSSALNVLATGTSDWISLPGTPCPQGATLVGAHSGRVTGLLVASQLPSGGYIPLSTDGGAVGWNQTQSWGELDLFNNYPSGGPTSVTALFWQRNAGNTSFTEVARLLAGGTLITQAGLQIFGTGGPTWTSGTGAPSGVVQPAGSLFSRTDGATGSRLYVSAGSGTWAAVSGV